MQGHDARHSISITQSSSLAYSCRSGWRSADGGKPDANICECEEQEENRDDYGANGGVPWVRSQPHLRPPRRFALTFAPSRPLIRIYNTLFLLSRPRALARALPQMSIPSTPPPRCILPLLQERLLLLMEGHADGTGDVQQGEPERVFPIAVVAYTPFANSC